jgi:AcrR family transcriptional regulator
MIASTIAGRGATRVSGDEDRRAGARRVSKDVMAGDFLREERSDAKVEASSNYEAEELSASTQAGVENRPMTSAKTDATGLAQRPKRADARRNYDKLLAAARDAFAQDGAAATLDDIARRAGVGAGTLYRHFPTRQHLLEAVYIDEVEEMCRSAADLVDLPPWDALVTWLRQFVLYAATKRALAGELIAYIDQDAEVFRSSRQAIVGAGDALLARAQQAGVARADMTFVEVGRLLGSIAAIRSSDPQELDRMLEIVLDGLRYRPPGT